jgi:hypothetical protein
LIGKCTEVAKAEVYTIWFESNRRPLLVTLYDKLFYKLLCQLSCFYRDLNPNNILVSDAGEVVICAAMRFEVTCSMVLGGVVLTYFGSWDFVEEKENTQLAKSSYVAPG